jgi:DNA-binding transcriptional ArsR family regulator
MPTNILSRMSWGSTFLPGCSVGQRAMSNGVIPQKKSERRDRIAASAPRLGSETVESIAAMLRVLADPTRIRLIETLNDRGRATVSALTASLPVSQQNVSKQLAVLHQAGIVSRRREGVWVHYELTDFTGWWLIEQLAGALLED